MINKQELLFVVDEHDSPLTPLPRHEAFEKGHFRRTAHVWIINSKKQLLCQKRSKLKDISPGKWEPAVGGHLSPGDNYFTGAAREAREETGLPITAEDLVLHKIYKNEERKEYCGIFYCNWDAQLHEIKAEEDEVEEIKFLHINTLKKYLVHQKSENWIIPGYEKEILSVLS